MLHVEYGSVEKRDEGFEAECVTRKFIPLIILYY